MIVFIRLVQACAPATCVSHPFLSSSDPARGSREGYARDSYSDSVRGSTHTAGHYSTITDSHLYNAVFGLGQLN
jgi:hypothetical protein